MATRITLDGYDSYSGADILVTAQLSNINSDDKLSKKCYVLGSLQTISISTYQDKSPVRAIGNINALDYLMGPRSIAGSLVFAVFDRHFAYDIFNDLKEYTGQTTLLTDEIPALDMTINFQNEYGKRSRMTLYGVKMVSEGQVMSINDLFTENTYQFVGTGLENLTPEDSSYPKLTPNTKKENPIINPSSTPFSDVDNSATGNKFEYNRDNIITDPSTDPEEKEIIHISINQPLVDDDYGTITVGLNDPNAVNLVMTNQYIDEDTNIYDSDMFNGNEDWDINVPQGVYNIVCIDKNTNEILDEVTNIVIKLEKDSRDLNDYPLINFVSDTYITVEINNPDHNKLTILQDNNIIDIVNIKDSVYTFYDLLPSTKYSFYSSNSETKSKTSTCITLSQKHELENNFKNYVFNNKDLWINDLALFNYSLLNNDNNSNLIDKILSTSFEHKDELLLYAIKYQNDFLKCINSDNDINIIENYNLLKPDFNVKDSYDKLNFYFLLNNKYYYSNTKDSSNYDEDILYTINNKHYYLYAIDSNKLKSLKYDFYSFDNKTKDSLKEYSFNELDYNNFDYNNYKNDYNAMDEALLETIILKDNNLPTLSILDAPEVSYDNMSEEVYIKLDYQEFLEENEVYYLCISNKNDMFQNTPTIKIKFSYDVKELVLNKYISHILSDNYYLIYIENSSFDIISQTSILSTKTDTKELDDYNLDNMKIYLNRLKSYLLNKYSCKDLIETVYLSMLSYNFSINNLINMFEQELLNEGVNSLQYNNLDSMFYDVFTQNYNNDSYKTSSVSCNDDEFKFNEYNLNVIVLDFYVDNETPEKNIFSDSYNTIIKLNDKTSYYTVIYGINKRNKNKTGFFLRNNVNKKNYFYKLSLEEVSK